MKKLAQFLDIVFGFSLMKEGAKLMVTDVIPFTVRMAKLALSNEGRIQLEQMRRESKEQMADRPDLLAIRAWFPWTFTGITFLIAGYTPLYFFLLQGIAAWPFDFMSGFAGVLSLCVFGIFALLIVPAIRYRKV